MLTLLVRAFLGRTVQFCGTPDACYYLGLGQSLARGEGFRARFLFDFQQAHPTLPNTGLEYWRPGVSLLLQVLRPFGGVTLRGGVLLATLGGLVFAAAVWHVARRAGCSGWTALGALAICLTLQPVWVNSLSPDSGIFYGAAVAWFLALMTVRWQGYAADLLALGCVLLAYLIRNDVAVLLFVPFAVVLLLRQRAKTAPAWWSSALVLGYLLALLPMHLIYHQVLGTAFPPGTSRVLWLWDLGDFSRYAEPATPARLLQHGIGALLRLRLVTLASILYRVPVLMLGFPSLLFLPVLLVRRAGSPVRLPEWAGTAAFGLTTLAVYALVLPAVGGFAALRSAMGILPFACVLVVLAIRSSTSDRRIAAVLLAGIALANALGGFMDARRLIADANLFAETDRAEAAALRTAGALPGQAVIMINDPVQFSVTTGYATVALPGNGPAAMGEVVRLYGVTDVLLDSLHPPVALPVLLGSLPPAQVTELPEEHTLLLHLAHTPAKP